MATAKARIKAKTKDVLISFLDLYLIIIILLKLCYIKPWEYIRSLKIVNLTLVSIQIKGLLEHVEALMN